MKKPIVFCTESTQVFSLAAQTYVEKCATFIRAAQRLSYDELIRHVGDADGLICMGYPVDARLLDAAPRLKVVSTISVGFDPFDLAEMKKRGVIGLHTPDVLNVTVADMIIALMLAVGRRMCELDGLVRGGGWPTTPFGELFGKGISGKKLGVVGMGRIGDILVRKVMAAFDMQVSYYDVFRKADFEKEHHVRFVPFDELLKESDYIVAMVPLTQETRHLFGRREFALMKSDAIFVNASRGPVVDEYALTEALREHQIFGAGLDVFEAEPTGADNPLTKLSNAVLMPHVASYTFECREAMAQLAAEGIAAFFNGQKPKNLIPFFAEPNSD